MSTSQTAEQLLDALIGEVAQYTVELVRMEHVSTEDAFGERDRIAGEVVRDARTLDEPDRPPALIELSARLRRLELLERLAVLHCGLVTAELAPMKHGTYCSACLAALVAQAPPLDSRLYTAAQEIQREADRRMRSGQAWVPGTDWLFEVMHTALRSSLHTPEVADVR
jgi:hypothetical protein